MSEKSHVFIITENGRKYSEVGICYIESVIREDYNDNNELMFFEGEMLNKRETFTKLVLENDPAYIFVSSELPFVCWRPQCAKEVTEVVMQDKNKNKTTWEILYDIQKKVLKLHKDEDENKEDEN